MELFDRPVARNLLPYDGEVVYYGRVIDPQISAKCLHSIEWKNDEAFIFGRHIITKRKVAWYGDSAFDYTYSNATRRALPWTKELLMLKSIVSDLTKDEFNSCLLNLYHNGDEGVAWHSDDEKALGKDSTIASLSFGAERKFSLKHKHRSESVSLFLEPGSLLLMKGTTQTHWLHSLPKTKKVISPRVNLTFTMVKQ